jgi:hypothetical protein
MLKRLAVICILLLALDAHAQRDFHLRTGSPAIDKGVCIPGINTDIEGRPRPSGAGCDIGAYEYGTVVIPTPVPPPPVVVVPPVVVPPVVVIPPTQTNQPPTITLAPALSVTLPAAAQLQATATDDGLPNGTLTYKWTVITGMGLAFGNPEALSTQVAFINPGTYLLRLAVSDGQITAIRDVTITVKPPAPADAPPTVKITNPTTGQSITGNNAMISVTTADDQGVTSLLVLINGVVKATASTNATEVLTFRWKARTYQGQAVTIEARATDTAGHTATDKVIVSVMAPGR